MFIPSVTGAEASTDSIVSAPTAPASTPLSHRYTPPSQTHSTPLDHSFPERSRREPIRHMLFGSITAVRSTIRSLHKRGYAEPNDWSQPISTGRPNEVMAILTKRIKLES